MWSVSLWYIHTACFKSAAAHNVPAIPLNPKMFQKELLNENRNREWGKTPTMTADKSWMRSVTACLFSSSRVPGKLFKINQRISLTLLPPRQRRLKKAWMKRLYWMHLINLLHPFTQCALFALKFLQEISNGKHANLSFFFFKLSSSLCLCILLRKC